MYSNQSYGSAVCFGRNQYKDYYLFCPYAYKPLEKNGTIEVIDIAALDGGYDYTKDLNAVYWQDMEQKVRTLKLENQTEYYSLRINGSLLDKKEAFTVPVAKYTDGVWTRPYYEFVTKMFCITSGSQSYSAFVLHNG